MEAADYNDINAWQGGKPIPFFYSQDSATTDEIDDHEAVTYGLTTDMTAPFNGFVSPQPPPTLADKNAAPSTGGTGFRDATGVHTDSLNYYSAQQLGAINHPYSRQVSTPAEVEVGGYGCSSGNFMDRKETINQYLRAKSPRFWTAGIYDQDTPILYSVAAAILLGFLIMHFSR
jgi:hypothetical protein